MITKHRTNWKPAFCLVVFLALCLSLGHVSWAAGQAAADTTQAEKLIVTVGKSVVIEEP